MHASVSHCPNNSKVFIASLLSFMILIAPIASVSAALPRATKSPMRGDKKNQSVNFEKPKVENATTAALSLTVNDAGDAADLSLDGLCDTDPAAGSQCTLRAAIQETNNAATDDIISFSLPPASTVKLLAELPAINGNLVITGPAADLLTVQRSFDELAPEFRIFTINSGTTVTISGLTVSNGRLASGSGGGIFNDNGQLTLNRVAIRDNNATTGGGIFNNGGMLTINESTISTNNNSGELGGGKFRTGTESISNGGPSGGGGLFNSGAVNITNSTISANLIPGGGGGVENAGTLTLVNVTVYANSASGNGGGIDNTGSGTLNFRNTIIAGNSATNGLDLSGANLNSQDYNLIGDTTGTTLIGITTHNIINVDAGLGPLANNGGPTLTHALVAGSPAIDAGDNCVTLVAGCLASPLTTDQRGTGVSRIVDGPDADTTATVDIGALEAQPAIEDISNKLTNEDVPLPTFSFNVSDGGVSAFDITVNSDDQTLVPLSNIILGGSGSTRTLTITPAPDQFGEVNISVTVTGTAGGAQVSMTDFFLLTVNPVNDAPSFTKGPNQVVAENAGLQTVADWATDLLAGPPNEAQSLTFLITGNSNSALFATQPAIDSAGTLTYTPAAHANGVATVTIVLKDDAGTADGGLDTSTAQTFIITVNAVNDAPVNSVPGPQNASKNGSLTFSPGNSNLISVSDVDATSLQVQLNVVNGTVTLGGVSGLSFTVGDGAADSTMTYTGTIANINTALNGLQFTPTAGFTGAASLQIVTNDQGQTGSPGPLSDSDTINIAVVDAGVLQFSAGTYSVAENGGNATITVTRTGGTTGEARVNYATSSGTATAGQDYTVSSGTLIFADSVTTQTFNVPIADDTIDEPDETINLTLSSPAGTGSLGSPSTAILTITDDDPTPAMTINDVSVTEGDSGTVNAVFTVTLPRQSSQTITVNFATADGTATAGTDYVANSGTLTFLPLETTKTITVVVNGDVFFEAGETFFVNLSGATNATIGDNQGLGTVLNDDAAGGIIKFSSATFTTTESSGSTTITVERSGDTTGAATVDYASVDGSPNSPCSTINGMASQRCDYTLTVGTLRFAAGETSKTFDVLISQDSYVEGAESLTLTLSNLSGGAVLATPSMATLTISDDVSEPTTNPMDDASAFVRQQYHDFLNREPDSGGQAFWTNEITKCGSDTRCIHDHRIDVSAAFFVEGEFQQTAYFVYRMYLASYGRRPTYAEFMADRTLMDPSNINASKQQFADLWVQRMAFTDFYDPTLTNTQFVNKLFDTAGLTGHATERQAAIDAMGLGKTRAQVVRDLVETPEFSNREFNGAFVAMQYFGYLRRDPEQGGYLFWLDVLNNQVPNNFRAMVCAFLTSSEYQLRFGPTVTRTNADCGP